MRSWRLVMILAAVSTLAPTGFHAGAAAPVSPVIEIFAHSVVVGGIAPLTPVQEGTEPYALVIAYIRDDTSGQMWVRICDTLVTCDDYSSVLVPGDFIIEGSSFYIARHIPLLGDVKVHIAGGRPEITNGGIYDYRVRGGFRTIASEVGYGALHYFDSKLGSRSFERSGDAMITENPGVTVLALV